jgi:hypothetical protein
MTITERIEELRLQIQELQIEERIAEWMHCHPAVVITSKDTGARTRPWFCDVGPEQTGDGFGGVLLKPIAKGRGNTEADARAHAFSIIFAAESGALVKEVR